MHFPEELTIKSFGSGYGGNALLGVKMPCITGGSIRQNRRVGLLNTCWFLGWRIHGETHYIAAAFPSACGNQLGCHSPQRLLSRKVGKSRPSVIFAGCAGKMEDFGVNPWGRFWSQSGTQMGCQCLGNAHKDAIFHQCCRNGDDNQPWWEGLDDRVPVLMTGTAMNLILKMWRGSS